MSGIKSKKSGSEGKSQKSKKTDKSKKSDESSEEDKENEVNADGTKPHRKGAPIRDEYLEAERIKKEQEKKEEEAEGIKKEPTPKPPTEEVKEEVKKDKANDTFMGLFRNQEEADAFKQGKLPAEGQGNSFDHTLTIEWSQQTGLPPQMKTAAGYHALTHKGTIIKRGFNVEAQRKKRITSTQDYGLLHDPRIQNMFNEDRHKMTSYIQ